MYQFTICKKSRHIFLKMVRYTFCCAIKNIINSINYMPFNHFFIFGIWVAMILLEQARQRMNRLDIGDHY